MTTGTEPVKTNGRRPSILSRILRGAKVRIGKLIDDDWFFKSMRLRMSDEKLTAPHRQVASVYSSVSRISTLLSSVPFRLVTGEGEDQKELHPRDNEVARLFRRPNPAFQARATLWEITIFQKYLKGGSIWVLTGDKGERLANEDAVPTMIFPLSATLFTPVKDKKTGMIVEGYELTTAEGKKLEYKLHELIVFKFHDPFDPISGLLAPLDVAKISVEQDHAGKRWNWALFKNFCQPSGIVTIEGTALPEERDEIRDEIKDRHQGVDNQYDIAVLPLGAKWEKTSDSHHDMQFETLLKFFALEVYEIFGVNKFVVGDVEELNYASALVAERQVYKSRVIPEMRYIEDILEEPIDRWSGENARGFFDESKVEALKQGLTETLMHAKLTRDLGYSVNMVNAHYGLGLPEIDEEKGGDTPLVPVGLRPLEQVASGDTGGGDSFSFSLAAETLTRSGADDFDGEQYWRAYVKRGLDPFEKAMTKRLRRHFFDLQKEVLENLAKIAAKDGKAIDLDLCTRVFDAADIVAVLFDLKKSKAKIKKALEPIFERIFLEAISMLDDELPGGLQIVDSNDKDLRAFLSKKKIKVTRISNTVRERIRKSLTEAIKNKETIQKITNRLRDQFKFARARALTIARTETGQTQGGVRFLAMKKEGIKRHRWITAKDDEVRDSHLEADLNPEDWIVPIGTTFPNGLKYPSEVGGPAAEVINCRCVAVAVVDDEGD